MNLIPPPKEHISDKADHNLLVDTDMRLYGTAVTVMKQLFIHLYNPYLLITKVMVGGRGT